MSYKAKFQGWDRLSITDLLAAYRKAKADCFFENTFPTAVKFAEFEQNLYQNIENLKNQLVSNKSFFENEELLGECRLVPKKLSLKLKKSIPANGHVHLSNPNRAVEHLLKHHDITPEFRIIGDFPVEAHIISALWINMVGHKFDAKLSDCCYGARLKRIRIDNFFNEDDDKEFHISSVGSFVPYFQPYQKWRNDGLNAIRGELEKKRNVIAVSLDLKSYYHSLDAGFLVSKDLHSELDLNLTNDELTFTKELILLINNWSKKANEFSKEISSKNSRIPGGLVIGLTASRIISNVHLHVWDKLIQQKIAPIHYGRYVDDMFLVIRDTGTICNSTDLMNYLQERLGEEVINKKNKKEIWEINQGKNFQGKSKITLQGDKQKLFILQGRTGLDLLDSIEKDIHELSSEHRLMPTPDQLEDSTAARVLSASGAVGEKADTLRRADGLTIRRLSWSLQLRHVETLAKDLPSSEWKEQRSDFYQFAYNHIIRPDNLFNYFNYLPRLLGFAISMGEWNQAEQIVLRSFGSIEKLKDASSKNNNIEINGVSTKAKSELWDYLRGSLIWQFIDIAIRYYSPEEMLKDRRHYKEKRLEKLFLEALLNSLNAVEVLFPLKLELSYFHEKSPLVAMADLAKEPYKNILKGPAAEYLVGKFSTTKENAIIDELNASKLVNVDILKKFMKSTQNSRLEKVKQVKREGESYLPYLFPTRPLNPDEISALAPECVGLKTNSGEISNEKSSVLWAKYTQALRGVWVKPILIATEQDSEQSVIRKKYINMINIGTKKKKNINIALTNFKTDDDDWSAMASGKSNLTLKRYQRLSEMVNQTLRLYPKPDYVIFPELSLPLRWVNSISSSLNSAGISLIAGTEYRHYKNNKIISEAYLSLLDDRLGYPAFVRIFQPKLQPAVSEDKELITKYGKQWAVDELMRKLKKPVYIHNDFHFGLMVCSELQNSKERIKFQGCVDALIVLSWNQDLETFSSLIESTALDVHAYTVLVNNRKYGDSRIRVPAKQSFSRDLARVRGGENDFVVAATLDIEKLRAFQSRALRWPSENDPFKPVPEGFKALLSRKVLPPK
ncbi:RNA-directed DNA polymerase [Photobacterium damselae]|uniref:RNA-directed DNA polymerase n=1 Tax=Photobacterium damselae TaxID=38293 RepID=UPI0013028702|nr:RNA-directed DNA polymerase [Photobacterium damselae]